MDSRGTDKQCSVIKNVSLVSLSNNKPGLFIPKLEYNTDNFPSFDISIDDSFTKEEKLNSSSRRKRYFSRSPCTYNEFVKHQSQEDCKPTVVDKLISKNKFALIETQMKQRKKLVKPNTVIIEKKKGLPAMANGLPVKKAVPKKEVVRQNGCKKENKEKVLPKNLLKNNVKANSAKIISLKRGTKNDVKKMKSSEKTKVVRVGIKKTDPKKSTNTLLLKSPQAKKLKTVNKNENTKISKRSYQTRLGEKKKLRNGKGRKFVDKNFKMMQFLAQRKKRSVKKAENAAQSAEKKGENPVLSKQSIIKKVNNLLNKVKDSDVSSALDLFLFDNKTRTLKQPRKFSDKSEEKIIKRQKFVENIENLNHNNIEFSTFTTELEHKINNLVQMKNDASLSLLEVNINNSLVENVDESDLRRSVNETNISDISQSLPNLYEIAANGEIKLENRSSISYIESHSISSNNSFPVLHRIDRISSNIPAESKQRNILHIPDILKNGSVEAASTGQIDLDNNNNTNSNDIVNIDNNNIVNNNIDNAVINIDNTVNNSGNNTGINNIDNTIINNSDNTAINNSDNTVINMDNNNTVINIDSNKTANNNNGNITCSGRNIVNDSNSQIIVNRNNNNSNISGGITIRVPLNTGVECNKQTDDQNSSKNAVGSINLDASDSDLCSSEPKSNNSANPEVCENENGKVNENENIEVKESILNALGLQSLNKVSKHKCADNSYTGTLKAVIKLHKTSDKDKGYRRMEMKQSNGDSIITKLWSENGLRKYPSTDSSLYLKENTNSYPILDTRFSDYDTSAVGYLGEYLSKMNVLSNKEKGKSSASLIVPEKSSSFSIHPNRLCSDVCKYCFGKFGSLDTPCHVAQLKDAERQQKILTCEPNLKIDTCLCDACYRYVDKKANRPSNKRKVIRRGSLSQRTVCVVQGCTQLARHCVKRKWLLKLRRKFAKLSFDVRKSTPRMSFGLCTQHYYLADFYTVCGLCKKRLERNHAYSVGSESDRVNDVLIKDGIPVVLNENSLLCKICRYCISVRLKHGQISLMTDGQKQHYQNFRMKVLRKHNLEMSNVDQKNKEMEQTKNVSVRNISLHCDEPEALILISDDDEKPEEKRKPADKVFSSEHRKEQKAPGKNYPVGFTNIANLLNPLQNELGDARENATRIQVKFGNLNIGKLSNLNIGQDSRTGETKHNEQSTQRESELPLVANFNFECSSPSQNKNWEKCVSTIQFDKNTKKLWQDLQKPYGNQSSFVRHLIMLEKYWRSGALILSETAEPSAVKYINSVKNRVESLESTSTISQQQIISSLNSKYAPSRVQKPQVNAPHIPQTCSPQGNPPPLVKVTTMPNQYAVIKAPNSAYLKSSDMKTMPPFKNLQSFIPSSGGTLNQNFGKRIYVNTSQAKNIIPVSLQQFKEKFVEASKSNNHPFGYSLFKKIQTTSMDNVTPTASSSVSTASISSKIKYIQSAKVLDKSVTSANVLGPKLPKSLTLGHIEDSKTNNMNEDIATPFLVGEKPSVSLFREFID